MGKKIADLEEGGECGCEWFTLELPEDVLDIKLLARIISSWRFGLLTKPTQRQGCSTTTTA